MSQPSIVPVLVAVRDLVAALRWMPEHQRVPLMARAIGTVGKAVAPQMQVVLVPQGVEGVEALGIALAGLLNDYTQRDDTDRYETEAALYRLAEDLRKQLDGEVIGWLEG